MSRVRIVGGGLTGILAALEAHRLGCRDIVVHERFPELGGAALPRRQHGLELRDGCARFGPKGDPIRTLLEWHGAAFEEVENRCGSVSPGANGERVCTDGFAGPALAMADLSPKAPAGENLADRLRCYPPEAEAALTRYARWRLGDVWLDEAHASAATPMGVNRVYRLGADPTQRKRADPLADELYGFPPSALDTANPTAGLPRGGFAALFRSLGRALDSLGVRIEHDRLVSPRQALAECGADEVLVWAADPAPLFGIMGLETPKPIGRTVARYVFRVRWTGPTPFQVQNFTAMGAVFRACLYESRGESLLTAECVTEAPDGDLRREIARLLAGFGGESLEICEQIGVSFHPFRACHSMDAMKQLKALHARTWAAMGAGFVAGAWEPHDRAERFTRVNEALALALQADPGARRAA